MSFITHILNVRSPRFRMVRSRTLSGTSLFIAAALVLILSPIHGAAQDDRRISRDPVDYVLPYDIRIHSASEIGSVALTVWGTRMETDGGMVINALEMNLEGSQRKLTGEDARPYGAVHVISLRSRFVVVWNDRRDGADGIYAAIVDSQGRTERIDLLSPGGIMEGDVYWMEFASGTRFFWSDTRGDSVETYSVTFADDGDLLEGPTFVRGVGIDEYGTYPTSGGWLYLQHTDGDFTVVRRSGLIDRREIPGDKLSLPYYLLNDTAMVGLGGGEMRFYSSLYQEEPDSSFRLSNPVPERAWLSRDSGGYFWLNHETGGLYIHEVRRYLPLADSSDTDTTRSVTVGFYVPPTAVSRDRPKITHYSVRTVAQNSIAVEIDAYVHYTVHHNPWTLTVEGRGRRRIDGLDAFFPTSGYPARPRVHRLDSIVRSRIAVGSDTLSADFPPVFYRPYFRTPSLTAYGPMQCSWYAEGDSLYSVTAEDFQNPGTQRVRSLPGEPFQLWNGSGAHVPTAASQPSPAFDENFRYYRTDSEDALWWLSDTGWVRDPDAAAEHTFYTKSPVAKPLTSAAVATDPATSSLTTVTLFRSQETLPSSIRVRTVRPQGATIGFWSEALSLSHVVDYVPIDLSSGMLVVDGDGNGPDQCVVVDGDEGYETLHLPPLPDYEAVRFQKLYGDRFLRAADLPNGEGLLLELFTTDCRPIASRTLTEHPYKTGWFVLQNPADSGLILLSGSSRGVRLSYLGKQLGGVVDESGRRMIDIQVSETSDSVAHPAGIVRNDTLFTVWEDFRLGNGSDIFGTGWKFPSGLREAQSSDTISFGDVEHGIEIRSVRPNPAYGQADLIVESAIDQSAEVTVFDGLGRMVSKRRVVLYEGLNRVAVGRRWLPSGTYQARVEPDNGRARTARLILYQR